jgi:hypothetical protein
MHCVRVCAGVNGAQARIVVCVHLCRKPRATPFSTDFGRSADKSRKKAPAHAVTSIQATCHQ